MTETLTTALYLFSSLLQADAAILGLGALFVVYKMQALDSRLNLALTLCRGYTHAAGQLAVLLMRSTDDEERATHLRGVHASDMFGEYEAIVTIPTRKDQIRKSLLLPLVAVSGHCAMCSYLLWQTPNMDFSQQLTHWVINAVLVWFAFGLFLDARLAYLLAVKYDSLTLKKVKPKLHALVFPEKKQTQ